MRILVTLLLLSCFAIIFLLGIFVGIYKIFPYSELNNLKDQLEPEITKKSTIDLPENLEYTNKISIETNSDIIEKRNELIQFIWKTNDLPNQLPNSIENNINDVRFDDMPNLKNIEKLTVEMEHGFISHSYLFLPNNSNGKLIIYHQGHSGGFINGKQTIQDFIDSGFSVVAFSMPMIGMNNQPTINIENTGPIKFLKHNQLVLLESEEFSSLKLFFEPINSTLNYLENNYSFSEFHMVGISGGGWTSTVYPALDPRISKSFSVAGSLPLSLRNTMDDVGDYEQFHPQLYSIANYFELYVMSSIGNDRAFYQIFNKNDPCCFSGDIYKSYHESLKNFVSEFNSGDFDIILDDTHNEHIISSFTNKIIINKLS
jgi:hypothetical protein